jgi:hypothetical protein
MVEDWNRRQPVRLQSFHIEVIAVKATFSYDDYSWATYQWLETAQQHLWYCPYEGQDVAEYLTSEQTRAIASQLKAAENTSANAWFQTHAGRSNHKEAIRLGRQVFGQRFPTYG